MSDDAQTAAMLGKIKSLLWAIVILMILAIAYFAKAMLLPIVIGVLLALTLSPLVRGAQRLGLPPWLTAAALIFGLALTGGGLAYFMGGTVSAWVDDVPAMSAEIRAKLNPITESMEAVQDASKEVEELAQGGGSDDPDAPEKVVVEGPALLTSAVSNIASFLMSTAVGMVLALFLLASGDLFYLKLVQAMPRFADKKRALMIVHAIERRVSRYLLAIATINAGLGVAVACAMWAIGMPYFYMWGILAFALNFVPYIGALVGVATCAAVAIVTFDTLGYALLAPVLYLTLTSLEGQFVTPYLVGRRLELNTVSVFVTLIFWAWLWGVPGALMAVPALVVLKVIAENFEPLSTLSNFLAGRKAAAVEEAEAEAEAAKQAA